MWFVYGVLIYIGIFFAVMILGSLIGYALAYLECLKEKIQKKFMTDEEIKKQRTDKFMKYAEQEIFKRLTKEEQEYCTQATSSQEYKRRFYEILSQNKDIIRDFYDEMHAAIKKDEKK